MKRWLQWIIGLLLALLLLSAGLWAFRAPILRVFVERGIQAQSGFAASLGQVHLGWGARHLRLRELRLQNPPEFGGGLLLHVPEIAMHLDPAALNRGRLRFTEVRLNVEEINLVRDHQGRLNVTAPAARPRGTNAPPRPAPPTSRPKDASEYEFAGIDRLVLTVGRLTYTDLRHPENSAAVDFGVQEEVGRNLKTTEDVNRWLAGVLVRVAVQQYLVDPGRSRMLLFEMLARGLKRF